MIPGPAEVEFVVDFLYWDHSLYEWLDKTKDWTGAARLSLYFRDEEV